MIVAYLIAIFVGFYALLLCCWIAGCIAGGIYQSWKLWRAGKLKLSEMAPQSEIA